MRIVLLSITAGVLLHLMPPSPGRNVRESVTPEGHAAAVPPLEVAPPPRSVELPPFCTGFVIEVTKTSISLQWISVSFEKGVTSIQRDERNATIVRGDPLTITVNGRTITGIMAVYTDEILTITSASGAVTIFRRIDQPIRLFEAGEELAARETPAIAADIQFVPASDTYRLTDVRVGDLVMIKCRLDGGVNICDTICILRRPGGRIPPAPGERAGSQIKHHERAQAFQDLEEKGIPIPDRILPSWELAARRAKNAPMPREVIPRIPPAVP